MKINFNNGPRTVGKQDIKALLAFTLLEVMIAVAIFFMATFSILALVSQCLRSAHSLHQNVPTAGMVAMYLSIVTATNNLEERVDSGDFEDIAAGIYPDYTWESETVFYASNGLFQVNVGVFRDGNLQSSLSTLRYDPNARPRVGPQSAFK